MVIPETKNWIPKKIEIEKKWEKEFACLTESHVHSLQWHAIAISDVHLLFFQSTSPVE
jgi:hypothetical protein